MIFLYFLIEVEAASTKEDLYDPMEIIDSPVIPKQQDEEEKEIEEVQPEVPVVSQAVLVPQDSVVQQDAVVPQDVVVMEEEESKEGEPYESPTNDEPNASPIFPLVKDEEAIFPGVDQQADTDQDDNVEDDQTEESQKQQQQEEELEESVTNDNEKSKDITAITTEDAKMIDGENVDDKTVDNETVNDKTTNDFADTDVDLNTSGEMSSTVVNEDSSQNDQINENWYKWRSRRLDGEFVKIVLKV